MHASCPQSPQPMLPLHASQAALVWGRVQLEHARIKDAYSSLAFSLEGADNQKKELESRLSQSQANVAREGRERSCATPTLIFLLTSEIQMGRMETLRSAVHLVQSNPLHWTCDKRRWLWANAVFWDGTVIQYCPLFV